MGKKKYTKADMTAPVPEEKKESEKAEEKSGEVVKNKVYVEYVENLTSKKKDIRPK